MFVLAVLAWAFQGQDLFHKIAPQPTGKNGYEEYLQAADILRGEEAGVFASWTPGAKPRPRDPEDPEDKGPSQAILALYAKLGAMTPLDVRREELRRFGQALSLVARGNAKPVYDPRTSAGPDVLFPEFASFRYTTRFAARAATVYAADGQTGRAAEVLTDELVCADNFGRGVLIANLVGIANVSITLAAFGDLLPRLSRPDAVRVERVVASLLDRPIAVRASMTAEAAFSMAAIRQGFASKEGQKGFFGSGDDGEKIDPQNQRWVRELSASTPASRQALLQTLASRIDERARAVDRVLEGPEKGWHEGIAAIEQDAGENPSDLADAMLAQLTPVFTAAIDVAARSRAQLRLLALHARLVQYRWDYGRYPETLDAVDPLTGGPYVYEVREDGTIRLASKGTPETGEIELKYKRSLKDDHKGEP